MTIARVILHIGAGKCGSSALQEYLSQSIDLKDSKNNKAVYGVLRPDGTIITRKEVSELALKSVFQYASSPNLKNIKGSDAAENSLKSLKTIDADTLILSSEGWINDPEAAAERLNWLKPYDVEIVTYVRPPVLWLNSAWWQWGAWSNVDFDRWINSSESMTYWSVYLKRWESLPFINKTSVRLLPKNIVTDFLTLTDLHESSTANSKLETVSNVSLPGSVLRVYQKYRELRPSPHESNIDFSLSRRLSGIKQSPDWVIDAEKIAAIIGNTKVHNEELKGYFDATQLASFTSDSRWWSADAFQTQAVISSERKITEDEMQEIVVHSFHSLHRAELEIIDLKDKLRKMSA